MGTNDIKEKINSLFTRYPDLKIIEVGVLYYFFARLGYYLVFEHIAILPFWPPAGIAFAFMILYGVRIWPGIVIASLIISVIAQWNDPHTLSKETIIVIMAVVSLARVFEPMLGCWMVKKWIKGDVFETSKNTFLFLFITMGMSLIGSGLLLAILNYYKVVSSDMLGERLFSYWLGNIVGILLVTPLILVLNKVKIDINRGKVMELFFFLCSVFGVYLLLHIDFLAPILVHALPFLVLPFLLWLAFRFDLIIVIGGIFFVSVTALYFTVFGFGPFANINENGQQSMLLLQIFIAVVSISTLVLSATVKERRKAQSELEVFNSNLEKIVESRTHTLNEEIDTRKKAEEILQKTNVELTKRNTELDNFVYSVSHDLRAPIASVLGLINLARKDKDPVSKVDYLDRIHKSALQQDYFIKEILDQSRNSRLEVNPEEVLFEPLIEETFEQFQYAIIGQGVKKHVQVQQEKPFYCDRWRIKIILNNIISNAIRYQNGKKPEINIEVVVKDHKVSLEIRDNGRGIGREHLSHIFKMFYRATDEGAGSGLGLYIVKEALDKLNGTIEVESELSKGTKIHMDIPEYSRPV